MKESEKRIRQEDCHEDSLGSGILTLTNKRIAFDKTTGRIADFSKIIGETVLDVSLSDVLEVWKEGLFMKKVCFKARTNDGDGTYKFGVFSNGSWLETIQDALEDFKSQ